MLILIFLSCTDIVSDTDKNPDRSAGPVLVEAPDDIAANALLAAIEYTEADTVYVYGGQDMLKAIKIDCSGLIVNCYKYAIEGSSYSLPFEDSAVINFYNSWTVETDSPRPGDLIFMGETATPTHISIFVKEESGMIYFIDSTKKPESGIDGVSERSYSSDDYRFLSFGRLLLNRS